MSDNYDSYNSSSNDYSNAGGHLGGGSTTYDSSHTPSHTDTSQSQATAARNAKYEPANTSHTITPQRNIPSTTNEAENVYPESTPAVNSDPVPANTFSEKRDQHPKSSENAGPNPAIDAAPVVPPPLYTSSGAPEITPVPAPATTTQAYSEKAPMVASPPVAAPQPVPYNPAIAVDRGPPTEFETGLCSCWGDLKVCCCAFWCSPCLFNRTHAVSEVGRTQIRPLEEAEKEWCGIYCVGYYLLAAWTGCGQIFWQGFRRGELRRQYNLKGTLTNDYLVTCCCNPCALAQEDIEVRRIERARLLDYQTAQQTLAKQNL
jgi:Cys-rich protein (TIGR01571 family)